MIRNINCSCNLLVLSPYIIQTTLWLQDNRLTSTFFNTSATASAVFQCIIHCGCKLMQIQSDINQTLQYLIFIMWIKANFSIFGQHRSVLLQIGYFLLPRARVLVQQHQIRLIISIIDPVVLAAVALPVTLVNRTRYAYELSRRGLKVDSVMATPTATPSTGEDPGLVLTLSSDGV